MRFVFLEWNKLIEMVKECKKVLHPFLLLIYKSWSFNLDFFKIKGNSSKKINLG